MNVPFARAQVSVSELRTRKPNLTSKNFEGGQSAKISTTILLEGDLALLLRDYYTNGEFEEWDLWVEAIQTKIADSLRFTFLDLIGSNTVESTICINFDRS